MAKLNFQEENTVEDYLEMRGGYVLDFSDKTFREFIGGITGIDIDTSKYSEHGSSKAKRLRGFIKEEDEYMVGKLFKALNERKVERESYFGNPTNPVLEAAFHKVTERLLVNQPVENINAIQANNDDKDFHQLARLIRESIEKNEPEAALDRLHTFMIKFLKELCSSHGTTFEKDDIVNALFGKYIKAIRAKGLISSPMAEKIVQFTFQVIEAFNDVRNNKSFAHDNPILNYDESVLIFSNVTATVKFLQSIETKHKNAAVAEATPDWGQF